jgi:hypothetical protein
MGPLVGEAVGIEGKMGLYAAEVDFVVLSGPEADVGVSLGIGENGWGVKLTTFDAVAVVFCATDVSAAPVSVGAMTVTVRVIVERVVTVPL